MFCSKLKHQPIEGEKVRIRLLEDSDVEHIRTWRNQEHVRKWFKDSRVIEPEQQHIWYERYKKANDDYLYIVESRELNWLPVGQVGLCRINLTSKFAEYGRMIINDEALGRKGMIHEASKLLFQYWHNTYEIENFLAAIKADNHRSIWLCSLLGFAPLEEVDGYLNMQLALA